MFLLIAFAFLLKRYGTQALPIPAPTTISAAFDAPMLARDDPFDGCQGRTVLDILWSCLATTFACTWLSVHPNVPFEGEGKWTLLKRRIFLMFFSILAPEFMIMWAFKQWRGAVMIREAINTARPGSGWTTTHGHFLQMGGFQLDNENGNREVIMLKDLKVKLRSRHIRLPKITKDEINDMSKGDALSKGFALLQLTWFIVQIITRAVQGLVITELELTTAALAGLNSIMYVFWWSKPHDVRFPVVIRTKNVQELLAVRAENVMWSFSDETFNFRIYLWTSMLEEISYLCSTIVQTFTSLPKDVNIGISSFLKVLRAIPPKIRLSLSIIRRYVTRIGRVSKNESQNSNTTKGPIDGRDDLPSNVMRIAKSRPSRSDYAHKRPIVRTIILGVKSAIGLALLPFHTLVYLVDLMLFIPIKVILASGTGFPALSYFTGSGYDTEAWETAFKTILYSEDAGVKPLLTTSSVAGSLFGVVHCLAWNFSFPSHAEQIMWRTASLGVVGSCVVTLITVLCPAVGSPSLYHINRVLFYLSAAPCAMASFVYPVVRIILLVLAVTSLRSLPHSAFDTVDWVEFVPHI